MRGAELQALALQAVPRGDVEESTRPQTGAAIEFVAERRDLHFVPPRPEHHRQAGRATIRGFVLQDERDPPGLRRRRRDHRTTPPRVAETGRTASVSCPRGYRRARA